MTPKELLEQIKKHNIELRPIHDLMPYARNSRKHEDWQIAKIAASIKEFGFTNPVMIDEDGTIIAGHARVMAAMRLDLPEVPCVVLGHMTPAQRRAYVIADNQLATLSTWDYEMLLPELSDLKLDGFNLELTGFTDKDMQKMLGSDMADGGREIGEDEMTSGLDAECPKCGFRFSKEGANAGEA